MKKCILLATIIPSMLFGQNNADTLKFEIIKASIKFLSTDNKSFPKSSGKVISCTFRDGYDCLKKYCKNNGLKGGEIKIDVWKKEIVNSKETLEDMKDKILKELTTGTVAKERLNLSGFGAYKIAITQLTTSFSEHDPQAEALNSDIENTKSITEIINPIVVEETNLNNQNKSKSKLPLFAFPLRTLQAQQLQSSSAILGSGLYPPKLRPPTVP